MINIWVGVSLIHSRPSTTSANRSGSASRSGRCGFIVSGVALRRRDRTGERAGHFKHVLISGRVPITLSKSHS